MRLPFFGSGAWVLWRSPDFIVVSPWELGMT